MGYLQNPMIHIINPGLFILAYSGLKMFKVYIVHVFCKILYVIFLTATSKPLYKHLVLAMFVTPREYNLVMARIL